jgi:hypothetical protein
MASDASRLRETHVNKLNQFYGLKGEARLRYLDNEYEILTPGDFVRCSVSGDLIALAELKYWSVERQEAYRDAAASLKRHMMLQAKG